MRTITSRSAVSSAEPHNVEAEQQLLGAVLLDARRLAAISDARALFHDPVHADLFDEISRRAGRGEPVSPVALKPWAEAHEGLRELGGPAYLARLAGASISGERLGDYAEILRDLRDKRSLAAAARAAIQEIEADAAPAGEIAAKLEAHLVLREITRSAAPVSLMAATARAIDEANQAYQGGSSGLQTGIRALDKLLGGMRGGDMVLLAGRPSMGKSGVALSIALNVARAGRGVVIASLEMTPEALATRAISEGTGRAGRGVEYSRIRRGDMSEQQFRDVVAAAQEIDELPIAFLPPAARDAGAITGGIQRAKALMGPQVGVGLVVVDYLQLLATPGTARSRYEEITHASLGLKAMAQRLGVPVLALSQLSRQVEAREDKRPVLSDLRESGQLEQDADAVVFTYRPEYYLARDQPPQDDLDDWRAWRDEMERVRNRLELIVAKNRGGEIGTARVFFNPALNRIWESERAWEGAA